MVVDVAAVPRRDTRQARRREDDEEGRERSRRRRKEPLGAPVRGGGGANEEEEEAAAAARAAVVDEVCAVLRRGRESREGALCVQTVFALLDTLSAWVSTAPSEQLDPPRGARRPRVDANGAASAAAGAAAASDAAAAALPTPVPPPLGAVDVRALASALALIPLPLLADAALAAGAHARATRYAETAARRRFGGALNPAANRRFSVPYDDATVSLLQTIAGRFGEPDGLSGLSHLRARPPQRLW